jgi:hypothetical protein
MMKELGIETDETTGLIEEQANEVDKLRKEFSDLIDEIFGHITTYNDYQESLWAVEEAEKAVEEALKKKEEAEKKTGTTFTRNDEALQAYLSTNIDYIENQQKQASLQKQLNEFVAKGDTSSLDYLKTQESLNTVIAEGNKIVDNAIRKTGTYTSTGKQTEEQIKATEEATREYEQSLNDLDDANIEAIKTAFEFSTSIEATKEEQEEARKKAVELGLQYVETGKISVEKFWEMASEFGLSSADIIKYAEEMGIELDEATKKRIAEIDADTTKADKKIEEVNKKLNNLDGKKATTYIDTIYRTFGEKKTAEMRPATGGIITPSGLKMAGGGFIGYDTPMLKAASGYTIPQTGREVPIIAHEGEVILNTSQQKNLAEAIWGVANGKTVERGISIDTFNVITPKGSPSEIARETVIQLRLLGMEAQLR